MNKSTTLAVMITITLGFTSVAATGSEQDGSKIRVPFSLSLGKSTYNKKCAECHGTTGDGSDKGPPMMHKYYEPSHHSDTSFYRAMTAGVKQHHWNFGDMDPVPGLTDKQMSKVIEYIRWLQKQNGIGVIH